MRGSRVFWIKIKLSATKEVVLFQYNVLINKVILEEILHILYARLEKQKCHIGATQYEITIFR